MGKNFFNKNNQAGKQSGNFGPKQQTNFKAKFRPPGKNQSGGGGFNKNKPGGGFNSSGGGGFNKNKPGGGFNSSGGRGFNKNKPGGFNSSGGGGFNKNKLGGFNSSGDGSFNKNKPGGFNSSGDGSFNKNKPSGFKKTPPTPQSAMKKAKEVGERVVKVEQEKQKPGAKVDKKKAKKETKGEEAKAQKEKLNFDEDSSDDEEIDDEELDLSDEEMDLSDEEVSGLEDEDELESDDEESDDAMTSPPKSKQNAETLKRKLGEVKTPPTPQSAMKKVKEVGERVVKVEQEKQKPGAKLDKKEAKKEAKVEEAKAQKEKLNFDEDSSDDEEIDDEEMDLSDEEMSGLEDEDEMESDDEESDDAMTSPPKSKQNAETLKRKLSEMKTPPTPQSTVKKARLEGGGERAVKIDEQVKEKPAAKTDKKETKKEKKEGEPTEVANQNIPKLSDEQAKAIIAEEDRRRDERDKRTLFTRCETYALMSTTDVKALHPDIVSVRHINRMCWLIFPSESSTAKAYSVLSKKKELNGKEFYVDFAGANSKNPPKAKGKLEKIEQRQINPLELILIHVPKTTTEEQLRMIFPTATQIDIPGREKSPGKTRRKIGGRQLAFIKFATAAEAKKTFEKYGNQTMLKIGGELVDVCYSRLNK